MSKLKQSVGIDVSKDKLDVCFSSIDSTQKVTVKSTRRFDNKAKGFKELEAWMKKLTDPTLPLVITMEATGVYYEQLAWFFFTAKRSISVILPNKARQYARCLGLKSKNDKIDSLGLARMGAEQNLPLWQPMSQDLYQLRCLTRELESLHQVKTGFTNQLHALSHTQFVNKSTQKRIQQLIKTLQNQINIIEKEIKALVETNTELKQGIDNITQIKGVALISAATVVAETNGFLLMENLKQVVSYAGYDVIENQWQRPTVWQQSW